MPGSRSYGDPCGIARALDLVGERWALLVVRELLYGPRRFSDLRIALGASPNVLSQRLDELETSGVVQQRKGGGALYELADRGRELHPILLQLGLWGARATEPPAGTMSVDALLAALEATFVPANASELAATYELRLGEDRFTVDVRQGAIAVVRGSSPRADVVIETDPSTLRAVVFGDRKLAGAAVELRGDARLSRAFFKLFERP